MGCNCKIDPEDKEANKVRYSKLLGKSKLGLAMSGDNAASTRFIEIPNSGTIPVFIADHAFTEALPFISKVPWRDLSFFVPETNDLKALAEEINAIHNLPERILKRKWEILRKYRDEISWTRYPDKVAINFIE